MGWSIWQSLKARERAKTPPPAPPETPAPPSMKILLEIFGPPLRTETEAPIPEPERKEVGA